MLAILPVVVFGVAFSTIVAAQTMQLQRRHEPSIGSRWSRSKEAFSTCLSHLPLCVGCTLEPLSPCFAYLKTFVCYAIGFPDLMQSETTTGAAGKREYRRGISWCSRVDPDYAVGLQPVR
jgi:hypothetical protein